MKSKKLGLTGQRTEPKDKRTDQSNFSSCLSALKISVLVLVGMFCTMDYIKMNGNIPGDSIAEIADTSIVIFSNPYEISNEDYSKIQKQQLAVKKYISETLKPQRKGLSDLKFNPDNLVLACYGYKYDLPLLLAQLKLESHFGTTPRARRTNSMFSVGSWDNGRDLYKYKTQDESIIPYIELMQKDYLQNGKKTVNNLLNRFVNKHGNRYAGDPNYESSVRNTRNSIIRKHPELAEDFAYD